MKKLLAGGCCVLAFQSFSQVASVGEAHEILNGKRVLIKAIAVMMNTDAYRKVPPRRICLPHSEGPQD